MQKNNEVLNKMKIFPKMNINVKEPCLICKTKKQTSIVLIPIQERVKGYNAEAVQIHVDCLDLWFIEGQKLIYQKIET